MVLIMGLSEKGCEIVLGFFFEQVWDFFLDFLAGTICLVFATVWNLNLSFCMVFATFGHVHLPFCMGFTTWACSPSILYGICHILACSPSILHGMFYM